MDYLVRKVLVLPGIIIGLTFHEYAHAKVASIFGDNTARNEGRVSLNPLRHMDILGFVCLLVAGFGWGKPVPVNPWNMSPKNRKLKQVAVSAAGVVMNFILAVVFSIILCAIPDFAPGFYNSGYIGEYTYYILYFAMYINIVLMIFNLIPIPPLDGFNIVAEITSFDETPLYFKLLRYGSIILIILLITNIISFILTPGINAVINIINGILSLIF